MRPRMPPRTGTSFGYALGGLLAPLIALLSCSYAPDFASDQLQCSATGKCPKGYSCAADNRCWKNGATPQDAAVTNDTGAPHDASTTSDGRAPQLADFAGTWTFNNGATGGTLSGTCSDSTTPISNSLSGDFMVVSLNGTGLLARYYCDVGWNLSLPSGSTTAVVQTGQTCTYRSTQSGVTTSYNFAALTFSLTTTNGQTGQFSGHLSGPFTATDGTAGTCNFNLSGQLTKTSP